MEEWGNEAVKTLMAEIKLSVGDDSAPVPGLSSDSLSCEAPEPRTRPLVATLEPYQPGSSGSQHMGRAKKNLRGHPSVSGALLNEVLPGVFQRTDYTKYLVIRTLNGKPVIELDIFEVHREIVAICGREPRMSTQGDGSLLVEVASAEESSRLQEKCNAPETRFSCTPHATFNQSRGVVYCRELLRYSEEKLLEELRVHKVVGVQRFNKKIDGILTPTPSLMLTFDCTVLPSSIKVAWMNLKVKPYVPNPRRCFHCQMYGHVGRTCRRLQQGLPAVCVTCGTSTHDGQDCPGPVKCIHCQKGHPASSKECDRFLLEKEILIIRSREKITFPEARNRALATVLRNGESYASVLSSSRGPHRPAPKQSQRPPVLSPVPKSTASHSPATRTVSSEKVTPVSHTLSPKTSTSKTNQLSSKRNRSSSESLNDIIPPNKVSNVESSTRKDRSSVQEPMDLPSESNRAPEVPAESGTSSPAVPVASGDSVLLAPALGSRTTAPSVPPPDCQKESEGDNKAVPSKSGNCHLSKGPLPPRNSGPRPAHHGAQGSHPGASNRPRKPVVSRGPTDSTAKK